MTLRYAYYDSPFGMIEVGYDDAIASLRRVEALGHDHEPSALSDLAIFQLSEYFEGKRNAFDLPIRPVGTPFQLTVWQALLTIPYGEVRRYKDIAIAIGNPNACRAVGMACNKNPIWVIIPCHRVVGSNRSLTGYAGGLNMKQALLNLEQQ